MDFDLKEIYGVELSLKKWQENFGKDDDVIHENVNQFYLNGDIELKSNTKILISTYVRYSPKNYTGWGGISLGTDVYGYELSEEEISEEVKKFNKIHKTNITQEGNELEIILFDIKRKRLEKLKKIKKEKYTNNEHNLFFKFCTILRDIANEKFKKKGIIKTNETFILNNIEHNYTVEIEENTSKILYKNSKSFYLFDKNNICYDYLGAQGITG